MKWYRVVVSFVNKLMNSNTKLLIQAIKEKLPAVQWGHPTTSKPCVYVRWQVGSLVSEQISTRPDLRVILVCSYCRSFSQGQTVLGNIARFRLLGLMKRRHYDD
jgi:hypothetical protein